MGVPDTSLFFKFTGQTFNCPSQALFPPVVEACDTHNGSKAQSNLRYEINTPSCYLKFASISYWASTCDSDYSNSGKITDIIIGDCQVK